MSSRTRRASTVSAMVLALGAAVIPTVGLSGPGTAAQPKTGHFRHFYDNPASPFSRVTAAANGVRTKIVIASFNCFEGAAPGIFCHGEGGLNSNKSACSGNRKMQVLWNGSKVASTKSDGAIHAWSFDDFPLPGAGTFKIVALRKDAGSITCKEAKRSFTVDAEGNTSLDRAASGQ